MDFNLIGIWPLKLEEHLSKGGHLRLSHKTGFKDRIYYQAETCVCVATKKDGKHNISTKQEENASDCIGWQLS
jgi:hypothetical protein